jgi:DNA polymerase-3 subunit epsilon
MNPIAVIDFETTGLSPAMGDRATEIAIVLLEGSRVVARFQSLMKAGIRISRFMAAFHALPPAGRAHRAMADAEVAAALLSRSSLTAGNPGFPPPRE